MEQDNTPTTGGRKTTVLLDAWQTGEPSALGELLAGHLAYLRAYVRRHASATMLARFSVDDFVQDAAMQILRHAPRFQVRDGEHFRRLLGRMILHSLGEKWRYIHAVRRDMSRESQVPSDSMLCLDPSLAPMARPSEIATQQEEEDWVRLGLELLPEQDRILVLLRNWEDRSFADIGTELGLTAAAARMRFHRIIERLGKIITELQSGSVPEAGDDV